MSGKPKAGRRRREKKRRLLILVLAFLVVSILASVAYGVTYMESNDAFNRLSIYCATYTRIQHVSNDTEHPFTHYAVTYGVNNPSSIDVAADLTVKANNPSRPGLSAIHDEKTFTVPHRDTALTSFAVYIDAANITLTPSDITIDQAYTISLLNFHGQLVPNNSLPNC